MFGPFFKALIIFFMINATLYGTSDIWPAGEYADRMQGLGPMVIDWGGT